MTDQQLPIDQALALAKKHAKNGQNATAKDIYERILAQQPDHTGAKRGLKKLPHNAKDKNNFRADMERLAALYESGREDEALAVATKLSRKYKTQPMPLNIRGAILTKRDQLPEAISAFKKAADLDPRYLDVWNNLGMAYQLNDQPEEALESYRRVITGNPNDVGALCRMGRLYRSVGDLRSSINTLERALSLAPNNVDALCQMGISYKQLGEEKTALQLLREAIELDPNSVDAHREFGETLLQMKMYTASLDHLNQAVELDPQDPYCQYSYATALLGTGRAEESIPHFEQSIELAENPIASAVHFLAIARGERPDAPAEGYVKNLFDDYATRFDKSLVGDLRYRGHEALGALLSNALADRNFEHAIDLGCGTGLFGPLIRNRVSHLTGVDLSGKMLEKARARETYDHLIEGDIVEVLASFDTSPDLVVSTDVLIYIGSLQKLFSTAAEKISAGGIFAFTTEMLPEGDFELLPSGRYAHSNDYILRLAADNSMEVLASESGPLRREQSEWLTGGYYVFKVS